MPRAGLPRSAPRWRTRMTDYDIRELLEDAVADVEPHRGIDDITSRTGRPRRSWIWGTAGAVVATAAVIAAFSVAGLPGLTGNGGGQDPAPATGTAVLPVYYVGTTGLGPRLFREERPV